MKLNTINAQKSYKAFCYIQKNCSDKFYLKISLYAELSLISDKFPECVNTIGNREIIGECQYHEWLKPPAVPTELPFPAKTYNRKKLKE